MVSWFSRTPPVASALTGVRAVLTALHRPPHELGNIHEHAWEITAWFRDSGTDAVFLRGMLDEFVKRYAGKLLPDTLSRGEALAAHVAREMTDSYYGTYCLRVEIVRHDERLLARWPA